MGKRAIEDFHFVDQTVEVQTVVATADIERRWIPVDIARRCRSPRADECPVGIDLDRCSVVGERDMCPLAKWWHKWHRVCREIGEPPDNRLNTARLGEGRELPAIQEQEIVVVSVSGLAEVDGLIGRSRVDPAVKGDLIAGYRERARRACGGESASVKAKGLSYLSIRERFAIHEREIVVRLDVAAVSIARPPTNHICRRRRAHGFALARGACGVDSLYFGISQRAVENFDFIDGADDWTTPAGPRANAQLTGVVCRG